MSQVCCALNLRRDPHHLSQLHDSAFQRAACVMAGVLSSSESLQLPEAQLQQTLSSAVSLLLETATWAKAPRAPTECRAGLQSSLRRLAPLCEANRTNFNDVVATAQQLESILCNHAGGPHFTRGSRTTV